MTDQSTAVQTEPGDVRGRLLAAALQLFTTKGYAATTVREIVEAAGVTKPVLYYHYGSKEGIYKAFLESALRDLEVQLGTIETLGGPASLLLIRLCGAIHDIFRRHTDAVRVMNAIYYGPPQGAPSFDFDRALFRVQEAVLRMVGQGIEAGEFEGDAAAMARAVLGVCNECIDIELAHPEKAVGKDGLLRSLDVVLRGMKREPGP